MPDAPLPSDLVPAWEEFLSRPRTMDDLFAHPLLFPLQRRREMEAMFDVVGSLPWRGTGTYMEIGADKGGSVWAWLTAFPASVKRCVVCEVRGTPYQALFERAFPHVRFLWLPQSSHDRAAVDCTRSWLGRERLDVLFLDGDKAHFRRDWDAYRPMVRAGGVVFVHDVTDRTARGEPTGPGAFWRDLEAPDKSVIHVMDEAREALDRRENGAALTAHDEWLCHWEGRSCGVGVVRV